MRLLHTIAPRGQSRKIPRFLPKRFGYETAPPKRLSRRQIYPCLRRLRRRNRQHGFGTDAQLGYGTIRLGRRYGHIAVEVDDAYEACERVKRQGGNVVREAGLMKHGTTVIAFVEDPDGCKIEFVQKKSGDDSVAYANT